MIHGTYKIEPLSVNKAYKGRKYSTKEHKAWKSAFKIKLAEADIGEFEQLYVFCEYGVNNMNADVDNPNKPVIDVLQEFYGFNDRYIVHLHNKKVVAGKGNEYVAFAIFPDDPLGFLKAIAMNLH